MRRYETHGLAFNIEILHAKEIIRANPRMQSYNAPTCFQLFCIIYSRFLPIFGCRSYGFYLIEFVDCNESTMTNFPYMAMSKALAFASEGDYRSYKVDDFIEIQVNFEAIV